MSRPTVAISMGDPFGIGPEIIAVALAQKAVLRACRPIVFGDESVLAHAAKSRRVRLPKVEVVSLSALARQGFRFGRPTADAGRASWGYLDAAIDAVRDGRAEALCTAPVNKEQLTRAGFRHHGHTDYLKERFGAERVVMMLAGPTLRVALATVHVPLRRVSQKLRSVDLGAVLELIDAELQSGFGVRRPRIAVTGLNPHAGEGGTLGTEEIELIGPAIRKARAHGLRVEGPFPADSLFARQVRSREFDAILAMSHDQGLGPLKAIDFERAVNVTLGLPHPRTSPDHGTAYDIAGKGFADATSMIESILLAAKLVR